MTYTLRELAQRRADQRFSRRLNQVLFVTWVFFVSPAIFEAATR